MQDCKSPQRALAHWPRTRLGPANPEVRVYKPAVWVTLMRCSVGFTECPSPALVMTGSVQAKRPGLPCATLLRLPSEPGPRARLTSGSSESATPSLLMALNYQTDHGLGSLWNLCRPRPLALGRRSSWQKQAEDEDNEHWPLGLVYSHVLDGGFTRRHWKAISAGSCQRAQNLLQRSKAQAKARARGKPGALSACDPKLMLHRAAAQRASEPGRPKLLPSTADREGPSLQGFFGEMVLLCSWVGRCVVARWLEGSLLSGVVGLLSLDSHNSDPTFHANWIRAH